MSKKLTFNQWLEKECCMNESQLTKEYVIGKMGYNEDEVEDYIQHKYDEYNNYLSK